MVEFRFSRDDIEPPSGFDLGHLEVVGNVGSASSRDEQEAMMIFISISSLLSGLENMASGRIRRYEFVGIDSAFVLHFTLVKGKIRIRRGRRLIDDSGVPDVLRAVWSATKDFVDREVPRLPEDDAGRQDIVRKVPRFRQFLTERFGSEP